MDWYLYTDTPDIDTNSLNKPDLLEAIFNIN